MLSIKDAEGNVVTYEYDANGNVTTYTYDKNGRRSYVFDEFNNRIQKQETGKETISYTYNNQNQLVETTQGATVTTYDYDKRGNLANVVKNGETKQTYTFDSTNKMSKVVTRKDATSGSLSGTGTTGETASRITVTTKYTYDGAGNRIKSKVENNGVTTSNTTYVIDTESAYNDIIMVKESVSGKTSIFTFTDEVISVETSAGMSYYRTDEKHSVTDILDTTGNEKATIEYDEFGVIANPEAVSTGGNIFAYTGHVYEESIGLYYAKARYYDAEIGRFVSEDSYKGDKKELLSLNPYIYGTNNPLKYTDPSGNMNYFTQTDDLIKGAKAGMESWIWDIIKSPFVFAEIIIKLLGGEITISKVIKQGLEFFVADIKYVVKNIKDFKPTRSISDDDAYELGYHSGRIIAMIVTSMISGKGIAEKFKNSKIGKKIAGKVKEVTSKKNVAKTPTAKKYYHVTTKEAANNIMKTGEIKKGRFETNVFAWNKQPTKSQADLAGIGSKAQVVLEFETLASFEIDYGVNPSLKGLAVQTVSGTRFPVKIFNASIVGFGKGR